MIRTPAESVRAEMSFASPEEAIEFARRVRPRVVA
jgi:hypothetical protein